jgi:hypothetical protein
MVGFKSAGLLNASPISWEGWDTFIPPSDVNCGVGESCKKLNTALPPRVCADNWLNRARKSMVKGKRKRVRKYVNGKRKSSPATGEDLFIPPLAERLKQPT